MKKAICIFDEGGNVVVDQVALTAAEEAEVNAAVPVAKKQDLAADLATEFAARYHAGYSVNDKAGQVAVLQFRNDADRQNISDVAQFAARQSVGLVIRFRCQDNVAHEFYAGEFARLADALFAERQAILHTYWAKRDAINAVEPTPENLSFFTDYDVAAGW